MLDGSDIELGAIELHRPSLDDVFLAKTGRSLRDA
jgi:ABC-2 type transport system ATP-binding protein